MYLSQGQESQSSGSRVAGKLERQSEILCCSEKDLWTALGLHLEVRSRNGRCRITLTHSRAYRNSLWGYGLPGTLHRSQARYYSQEVPSRGTG